MKHPSPRHSTLRIECIQISLLKKLGISTDIYRYFSEYYKFSKNCNKKCQESFSCMQKFPDLNLSTSARVSLISFSNFRFNKQWLHYRKWQFLIAYIVQKWPSWYIKLVIANVVCCCTLNKTRYCKCKCKYTQVVINRK